MDIDDFTSFSFNFPCCSVSQLCCCLLSHSLPPHEPLSKNARIPCPSLSPRVCSSSCPLSRWCRSTISSSATLFSFGPQSLPGSFHSRLFTSGGQYIGASASASVLPMNTQGWFPLGSTDLISLQFKYTNVNMDIGMHTCLLAFAEISRKQKLGTIPREKIGLKGHS